MFFLEFNPWPRHQTSVWLNKRIIKSCSCVCMLLSLLLPPFCLAFFCSLEERVCLICSATIKHLSISCHAQKAKLIWTHLKQCRKHMKQSKATLCRNVSELGVIKESLRINRKTEPNEATRFVPKQEKWKPEEQQHVYGYSTVNKAIKGLSRALY